MTLADRIRVKIKDAKLRRERKILAYAAWRRAKGERVDVDEVRRMIAKGDRDVLRQWLHERTG